MIKNDFMKQITLCLLFIIFIISCKRENEFESKDLNTLNYYPIKKGNTLLYQVDSIKFDDFTSTVDTFRFQIKEVYTDSFIDLAGDLAYKIERSVRKQLNNEYLAWENPKIWWISITHKKNIERTENNIRYINLVHPIVENYNWNGNAHNNLTEWNFRYTKINKSFNEFDSTLTVIQRETETLITKEYYEQKFAKNIGLVYYHYINITNVQNNFVVMIIFASNKTDLQELFH